MKYKLKPMQNYPPITELHGFILYIFAVIIILAISSYVSLRKYSLRSNINTASFAKCAVSAIIFGILFPEQTPLTRSSFWYL